MRFSKLEIVWSKVSLLFFVMAVNIFGVFGTEQSIDCHTSEAILQVHWNESYDISNPVFNCSVGNLSELIITNGNKDNMLRCKTVNSFGFVYFVKVPSYEEYQTFVLTVASRDQKGHQTTCDVLILIDDSDTHYPTFSPLNYHVSVNENTWYDSFASFLVTDGDSSDAFGLKSVVISFKPATGDYSGKFDFSTNLTNKCLLVTLKLNELLDYETTEFYYLVLVATDGGGLYTDANIIVNVIDQEDTPPEFTKIAPFTAIYENETINTTVVQVTAVDGDRGINHPVRYAIENGNDGDDFTINEVLGYITIKHELDADSTTRTSIYSLNISATEQEVVNKSAPHISYTICIITLIDVDDNPPVFSYSSYNASIDELSTIGTEVTFKSGYLIIVTDADMGNNAAFTVFLTDPTGIFSIDPMNGVKQETFSIIVKDPTKLNCDILQSVKLNITVTDVKMSQFVDMAFVFVTVKDVNNHWPEFSNNNYTIEINETTVTGIAILKVTAVDKDIDPRYNKVYYRIESGFDVISSSTFSVDLLTGLITVSTGVTMDRDLVPNYTLTVKADDGTIHNPDIIDNDTCTVNVILLDVNNKPPQFDSGGIFDVSIDENTDNEGLPIFSVHATDPDSDNLLKYRIDYKSCAAFDNNDHLIPGYKFDKIIIDENSGGVRLSQPLDREVTKTIVVGLVVADVKTVFGADHTTGHLTINVIDVNDNPPVFDEFILFGSIKENMANALISYPNGTGVLKISATDADAVYNIITLRVIGNDHAPNNTVTIDTDLGYLTVGDQSFDYEKSHYVNLVIEAADNGFDPQLTANMSVNISIIDQNDNPPEFQKITYMFYLPENNYTFVNGESTVAADDLDSGVFGMVTYLIRDPTFLFYFNVSETQGDIFVSKIVDYEQVQQIQGSIFAYDNFYSKDGSPINSDKTEVIIKIVDENDNWPQFLNEKDVVKTSEDANLNTPVGNVDAIDRDLSSKYNTLRFIPLNDTLFKIDRKTGQLTVSSSLIDRVGTHIMFVQVCDMGEPPNGPNCNSTNYVVDIGDVNNHPPVIDFPRENSSFIQREESNVDIAVMFVNITDEDVDIENKRSKFNMASKCILGPRTGKQGNEFFIQPYGLSEMSAEVRFRGNLSREICYVYQIYLMATNTNNPTMKSAERSCFLVIQSVYHHPPQFPPGIEFHMNFTEEQAPGNPVFFPASPYNPDDEGTGNFSSMYCYILGGMNADDFIITDHKYCNFTTARTLDREAIVSFNDMQVILVATEYDRQPARINHYDSANASQLLAHIRVLDINDNPPHFDQSRFFGGVSSETVKGTNFMNLTAHDLDTVDADKLRYSIIGTPTFHDNGNIGGISTNPFTLDLISGSIYLDYKFSEDQHGYIDFVVQVVDSDVDHTDQANVSVYIVSKNQKLTCLAEVSPDSFLSDYSRTFAIDFSGAIEKLVVLDVIQMHVDETGQKLNTLSDVYIHLVDAATNDVIDAHIASNIIDASVLALTPIYDKYHILRVTASQSNESTTDVRFYIVCAIAGMLAVLLAATISVCFYNGSILRRKLKAASVTAFGSQRSIINQNVVPNTNKHTVEGSNPIWCSSNWEDANNVVDDSTSEDVDVNSLQGVENDNEFSGGLNNPTFEQRIENMFKNADTGSDVNLVDDCTISEFKSDISENDFTKEKLPKKNRDFIFVKRK